MLRGRLVAFIYFIQIIYSLLFNQKGFQSHLQTNATTQSPPQACDLKKMWHKRKRGWRGKMKASKLRHQILGIAKFLLCKTWVGVQLEVFLQACLPELELLFIILATFSLQDRIAVQ